MSLVLRESVCSVLRESVCSVLRVSEGISCVDSSSTCM